MWSTLKRSSGAQLGHEKRDIPAFDTVLFHSNLSNLRRKYISDVPADKMVLSSGTKISKKLLKRRYWWLKNKERKCHFRFSESRFLAAINCTGSAEGALVPVLFRITHWPKSGLPVSPPGLFPPWPRRSCSWTYKNKKKQQLRNSSTTRPPTPDVREEDRILCRTRQNPLRNENVTS